MRNLSLNKAAVPIIHHILFQKSSSWTLDAVVEEMQHPFLKDEDTTISGVLIRFILIN